MGEAKVKIRVDSQNAKSQVKGFIGELKGIKGTAVAAAGALATLTIGIRAMAAAGREVGEFIGHASREFASFDQQLRNVGAVSGATREEIAALSEEALRLAKATRFSPEETAGALYSLASSGQQAAEQLASLPAVLDFAEAAQADLGLSTELVVRNLKSFNLEATEARRVADVLTASIGASALTADRLSYGMAQAGPAASVLGQTLETTVAAVALLVDRMGSGEMAGAGLKQSLLTLMSQADDLGIKVQDSSGSFRDLVDIIRDLEEAGTQGEKILSELGTRAGPAMSILVSQGADALEAMRDRVTSTGQAADVAGEQLDTLQGDMDIWLSAQDEFWKRTGSQFEDGTRRLFRGMTAALSEVTAAVESNGNEISTAWAVTVEAMVGSTEYMMLVLARFVDSFERTGLSVADAVQGIVAAMGLMDEASLILGYIASDVYGGKFDEAAGRREKDVREFFSEIRKAMDLPEAEKAAQQLHPLLQRLEDLKIAQEVAGELEKMGVAFGNLEDLSELNRILGQLDVELLKATTGTEGLTEAQKALQEAAGDLRETLALEIRQAREQANATLNGSKALADVVRQHTAYNRVLAAGIDPASATGKALLEIALNAERATEHLDKLTDAMEANAELQERVFAARSTLFTEGVAGARFPAGSLPVPLAPVPDADAVVDIEAYIRQATEKYEEMYGQWNRIHDNYIEGLQSAFASAFSEIFSGGSLDFETFAKQVAGLFGDILGQELSKSIAKAFEDQQFSGALSGTLGTAFTAVAVASIIASADDPAYAAAGAAIGAGIGAALGALSTTGFGATVGAKWGAVIGAWVGGMIKSGAPQFYGEVTAAFGELAITTAEGIGGGSAQIAQGVGKTVIKAVEEILLRLNAELLNIDPGIVLRQKEDWAVVLVDGIVHHFGKDWEAAVSFAVTEILKRAEIDNLTDTVRQVLASTDAESLEELGAALDFADWFDRLRLGDVAADLNAQLREYGAAIRRALQYGLDLEPINAWLGSQLTDYRNSILGIVESEDVRIRRQAEAFNTWLLITEAEQRAREADLVVKRALLEAEVSTLRAQLVAESTILRARIELRDAWIDVEQASVSAEWELLSAKMQALAAVEEALEITRGILAGLPDIISEGEIRDAINRARGAGGAVGPTEQDRDVVRREVDAWGLADVAARLHETGMFVLRFQERIQDMGFTAEETASLLGAAQEEQRRQRQEIVAEVKRSASDFWRSAIGTTAIASTRIEAEGLRDAVHDLGLNANATAFLLERINIAEALKLQEVELTAVGKLFGYLEGVEGYEAQILQYKHTQVELEFAVIRAQLEALGVFAQYAEIFNAALETARQQVEDSVRIVTPVRQVQRSFDSARSDAERIAESFRRAKGDVAEFLNRVLVGEFGGVSPVGGVTEAMRQFDEVLRQARTGNIGAIGSFDDYGASLLRLAEQAYASGPEYQAIRDYVLAAGAELLALPRGREGNLVFDERFYATAESQLSEQRRMADLLDRIERHLRGDGRIVRRAS